MWADALAKSNGPFLFGEFGIVDPMYASIVSRVASYVVPKDSAMIKYCEIIESLQNYQDWAQDGRDDTWVVKEVEK